MNKSKQEKKDQGMIMVLLERFNKQRLPRAKVLKKKVDAGELLNDQDLALIKEVQNDSRQVRTLLARHPEYQELAAEILDMWNKIIEKDMENRKTQK